MRGRIQAALLLTAVLVLTLALALGEGRLFPAPDSTASLPGDTPGVTALVTAQAEPTPPVDPETVTQYFTQVAFGGEYGGGDTIVKWTEPILVYAWGDTTPEDLAALDSLLNQLSQMPGMPEIRRVNSGGNLTLAFVPLSGLNHVVPEYVSGNWGYVRVEPAADGAIRDAIIGIATDVTNQTQRNHLILEETTQALGLLTDSTQYADSILYQPWTETQQLSPLDWEVLRLLYNPSVKPGMTRSQALAALGA